ncbi:MAG: hypothetical protein AABX89_06800 [Candidatus Thermoplasmatota archaeon]
MDDDAVGSPLAFIVAGVIFLAVVGILLTVAFNAAPSAESGVLDPGHRREAETTFSRFIRSAGNNADYVTGPGGGWVLGGTGPLGLATSTGELDLEKLRHLAMSGATVAWLPAPDAGKTLLFNATAHTRLGLTALDLRFRVEFTAIGADCDTAVFGPPLPKSQPLEPVSGTIRLAGMADVCDPATPPPPNPPPPPPTRPTLVEVRLYVFR